MRLVSIDRRSHRCLMASAAVAVLVVAAPGALAQEDAPAVPAEDAASVQETVIVTAMKRDMTLLETPAAVSAFGAETLKDQQVLSLGDLASKVPSLNVGNAAGVDYVSIRGISINSTTGGIENPVAIHIDGVYLAQTTALDFALLDPASVEVLRGPQGTLYGRNSTGGAVNFLTAKPTDTVEGFANAAISNYDTYQLTGALSGPLAEGVSGRVAVMYKDQGEGYIYNRALQTDLGRMDSAGIRAALRLEPAPFATIDVSAFAYDENNGSYALVRRNPLNNTARARNPILAGAQESNDPREVYLSDQPDGKRKFSGAIVTGTFDLGPSFELKSVTGLTKITSINRGTDTDGTEFRLGVANRDEVTESLQQEIDLNFDLFDGRLTGLVGLFYNDENWKLDSTLPWLANPQGFVSVGPILPVGTQTVSYFDQDTESKAAFTDFTFGLTDRLNLFAGYRFSQDKRDLNLTTGLQGLPGEVGLTCNNRDFSATFDSNTGKLGLQYAFNGAGNAYIQVQEGFKAGGFNPFGCQDTFEPEELTAFEAGYKASILGGNLTFDIAAFTYDYKNLQVAQIINNASRIDNAASAELQGIEFRGDWRLVPSLRTDLSFTWLDSQYTEFFDLDTLNPMNGFQDLSGNPLNRAPKLSGTIGVEADLDIFSASALKLRAEMYHSSRVYYRPYGAAADSQDAYETFNLYATFRPGQSGFTFRAYVKNAGNEDYLAGLFSAGLFADRWAIYAPPRTFGLSVGYAF